mmetsp:Transcript_23544/g.76698  ORF Transcript_23544/g.76698 Transcript_23544/m.76698 type:complete len:193 (-) Transcript_23544:844-1422(-)
MENRHRPPDPPAADKDASWYHQRRPKKERQVAEKLKAVWSEVLGVEQVETNVPFMEYGGDSLIGVTVIAKSARLGISLQLLPNFDMLSVDDLARMAISLRKEQGDKRGVGGQSKDSQSSSSSTACHILERDRREPGSVPKPIGGLSACSQGDLDSLLKLRATGWDPVHAVDKHGNTALMWSCGSGALHVAVS